MTADPFESAATRHRVLATWTASPVRFREDANAEEDLVAGGYRDRLVVELAQNAADAAARAGVPGELLLRLAGSGPAGGDPVLVAANTGAPLDAAGVSALATLRASAKRDEQVVGRFGVGFAAALAITDEPAVISRAGGVRFSTADTRELVRANGSGELAEELVRRSGHVPVLRLPFPAEATVPAGYDTVVVLPLRDPAAEDLARRLLAQVGDGLLLALPALARVRVEIEGAPTRVVEHVGSRWTTLRRTGEFDPDLLASRPTEERLRTHWQVTWALPTSDQPSSGPSSGPAVVPAVVHAPTPCDEPLPWPAVLVATLPLEPSRRHVAPGPVTDAVLRHAAEAYVDLLAERAEAGLPGWRLVPVGLPAGAVDGALRAELDRLLPAAPVLIAAEDGAPIRPRDAVTLAGPAGSDDAVLAALAPRLAGLVAAPRAALPVLRRLGVTELELADVVEALPEDPPTRPDPGRWSVLYAALAPIAIDPLVREALARLPVPLADGRTARGVRGLVLGPADGPADVPVAAALARLGARVVHPDAAHPLLERLGATVAGPRARVELDVVRAAVEASLDEGPEVRDAVLTLVAAATAAGELAAGDLPWLADLALPDEDGEPAPAGELALPGSPAARWFDPEEIGLLDAALANRWGVQTLSAVGVLRGPAPLRATDVPLEGFGPDSLDGAGSPAELLDGWDDWSEYALGRLADATDAADAGGPDVPVRGVVPELLAVRDLDAVAGDALPDVVAAVAADPVLRPALTGRCRVVGGRAAVDVLPYTAWWLRSRLGELGGSGRGAVAAAGARDGLAELLPPAAGWLGALDPAVQAALGVIAALDDVDAAAAPALFACLVEESIEVPTELLLGLLGRFAALAGAGLRWPAPPPAVRGLSLVSGRTVVVDADDAVVLDAPMYLQRPDLGVVLPVAVTAAGDLADLLDLPVASELVAGVVEEAGGAVQPTPAVVGRLLPGAPSTWCEHDELVVDGQPVDWWVSPSSGGSAPGVVHAATVAGLARGLAWAAGEWPARAVVEQVLADPSLAPAALLDAAF